MAVDLSPLKSAEPSSPTSPMRSSLKKLFFDSASAGSLPSAIVLYVCASVDTGVLALPYAFKEAGPLPALLLLFLAGILSLATGLMLARAAVYTNKDTYGNLLVWALTDSEHVNFNQRKTLILNVFNTCLTIFEVAASGSYFVYMADFLSDIFPDTFSYVTRDFYIYVPSIFVAATLSRTDKLQGFATYSKLSVLAVLLTVVTCVFESESLKERETVPPPPREQGSWPQLCRTFSICLYSFLNHINSVTISSGMQQPTFKRQLFALSAHTLILFLIYAVLGLAVYSMFYGETQTDFLYNYPGNCWLISFCEVFLSGMLFVACILALFPVVSAILSTLHRYKYDITTRVRVVTSFCLVFTCATCAVVATNVANYIAILTSLLGTPIMFACPGEKYLFDSR